MTRFDLLQLVCRTLEGSIFFNGKPLPVLRSPVLNVPVESLPVLLIWSNDEDSEPVTGTQFAADVRLQIDARVWSYVGAGEAEGNPDPEWDERVMALVDAVLVRLLGCGAFLQAFQPYKLRYSRRTYAKPDEAELMVCGETLLFSGTLRPRSFGPEDLPHLKSFGVTIDTAESGWDGVPEVTLALDDKG